MLQLDHLVIGAATLAEGAAWCERVFGITPAAGGQHAFMGTHNLLFSIAAVRFPKAYAEIIAIDPAGAAPARPRWFGLDEPGLKQALQDGPQLIHWVARTNDIHAASALLRTAGIEPGAVLDAERATPRGLLRWQIGLRGDGRRLFGGALPTLIEWGDVHPSVALPPSGVQLQQLQLRGVPEAIAAALGSVDGIAHVTDAAGDPFPALHAMLDGPRGAVNLCALSGSQPAPSSANPTRHESNR